MTEHLGSLEYTLKISEEELKKNIEKIEAELLKFNKTAEKALTIDTKKNKFLVAQAKILQQINETETKGILNKHKALQAQEKTIRETRRGAFEAKKNADAVLLAEQRLLKAKNLAIASQVRLNNLQNRRVSGVRKVNSAYKSQGLHLQNLHTLAANYISIFAVLNLSKQIAKITGEFELQRKALAAIIQSKEEADKLFDKVTDLALVSPFAIKDLLGYTKMLAAYRIESDQLIGTLSKLGDVSAGLGVDMSRLILAFGQVKAASVLRGQEIRQFTEAGIPMIALLADKFTELEGRVVSTNEVFDKVSKRLVSFERVSEIFDNMTAKGGIFFEAQRVQAETLAGMMSIFTDAMHKAFAAIGDDNEGLLKGMISGATGALDNWREILKVIRILVATVGIYKASLLALNIQRKASIYLMATSNKHIRAMSFATKKLYLQQNLVGKSSILMNRGLKAIGSTLKANAWLIGITAIVGLGVSIYEASVEANRLRNELKDLAKSEFMKTEALVKGFEDLADAAVKATDGSKNQREALAELNRTYKDYLPSQSMNIENLKKLKGNYDELTKAIINKSRARAEEKGLEVIQQSFQKESAEGTETILSALDDAGLIKRDAINIVKIFREEFMKNAEQDAGFLLKKTVEQYMGKEVELATLAGRFNWKTYLTGLNKAEQGAYKYGWTLKQTTIAQDQLNASLKSRYDEVDVSFKADADKMEALSKQYAKEKEDLLDRKLTKEEYTKAIVELNKEELQSRIDYFENEAKFGDQAYRDDQVQKFKNSLDALINTGGNFQNLVKGIIKDAGGDDLVLRKLSVKDDEDTKTYIKRVMSEYKDYGILIKQTEGLIAGYQEKKTEGWEAAVKTAKSELAVSELGLKITKALGKTLGFTLEKKTAGLQKEKKVVAHLKAQLKLYKEMIASGKELSKQMGVEDVNKRLKEAFGESARKLGVTIPMEFDTSVIIAAMTDLSVKAKKLGGETGLAWSKGLEIDVAKLGIKESISTAKKGLKQIDDAIKNYKQKNSLYEYIFGITKDEAFSFRVAFDADTTSLDQILRDSISAIDEDVGVSLGDKDTLGKSFTDMFNEEEIKALEERIGTERTAYLKKLYDQLAKIREGGFKKEFSNLHKALKLARSVEEKKIAIYKEFGELKLALDSKHNKQTDEQKEASKKELDRQADAEVAALNKSLLAATQLYKDLYGDMERFSVKKMKSIANQWDEILDKLDKTQPDEKGIRVIEIDGKNVDFSEEAINRITKAVEGLKKKLKKDNPFTKISEGFAELGKASKSEDGADAFAKGLELMGQGAKEVMDMISPLADAFGELADATDNDSMRNFAQDMQLAIDWGKKLIDLSVGIAKAIAGDPTALIASLVDITATLLKAEAEYQKAKRAFMADTIKMQRAYVLLLLEEQALFKDGTSIFGLNEFGGVSNNLTVLKDATTAYADEMNNLGDAMVKTGVKRKKFLGITVGKKDIYGRLLDEFPELIKNQDELTIGMENMQALGSTIGNTFIQIGENARIDINVAKSILATEKLSDSARATLEQLIALQEQIDAANKAISDYLSGVFGDIGAELSDALVQAFRDGNDAGIDFADNMAKTMDKLAQDIANSMILAPYFKDFEEQLNAIYKDVNLSPEEQLEATTKLMASFYAGLKDEQDEYNKFLQQSQDIAAQYDIDLFAQTNSDLSALTKGIQGLSEDTGRKLEALFNSNREINIQNAARLDMILSSMAHSQIMASQIVTIMQTMNQNLVNYITTFNGLITQGSKGAGLKTYIQ